jgi:hypothetical protein
MGEHRKALHYAKAHLSVSRELGDQMGQATAAMNVSDLRKVLGVSDDGQDDKDDELVGLGGGDKEVVVGGGEEAAGGGGDGDTEDVFSSSSDTPEKKNRRKSMDEMKLIRMTPDAKLALGESRRKKMAEAGDLKEDAAGEAVEASTAGSSRQQRSYSVGTVLFHNKEVDRLLLVVFVA